MVSKNTSRRVFLFWYQCSISYRLFTKAGILELFNKKEASKMDLKLQNKTALVTGSTKGIGKAIAESLAKEGANLIINGRDKNTVDQTVEYFQNNFPNSQFYDAVFDLSIDQNRKELFEKYPNVDILVNNMAIFNEAKFDEIPVDEWRRYFDVNVIASIELSNFYLKNLLKNDDNGRIIFISSEAAVMPSPEMPHYSMTKSMNLSYAKSLSNQTKGTTVTVNTVMPGSTLTEGVESLLKSLYPDMEIEESQIKFMKENRPTSTIQRLIKPQEIGDLVTFVASPLSGAISGSALKADGGIVPTII